MVPFFFLTLLRVRALQLSPPCPHFSRPPGLLTDDLTPSLSRLRRYFLSPKTSFSLCLDDFRLDRFVRHAPSVFLLFCLFFFFPRFCVLCPFFTLPMDGYFPTLLSPTTTLKDFRRGGLPRDWFFFSATASVYLYISPSLFVMLDFRSHENNHVFRPNPTLYSSLLAPTL